jgi:hypothetical protein
LVEKLKSHAEKFEEILKLKSRKILIAHKKILMINLHWVLDWTKIYLGHLQNILLDVSMMAFQKMIRS